MADYAFRVVHRDDPTRYADVTQDESGHRIVAFNGAQASGNYQTDRQDLVNTARTLIAR